MMSKRRPLPLEGRVLAAFHQAYAEKAFEVADRLLAILEYMAGDDRAASEEADAAVNEAYLEIASTAECNLLSGRPRRPH